MKMNPEESIPKEYPDEESTEGEKQGYSVVINCYQNGEHDVFSKPLERASEEQYPDGLFGLASLEDALRGVIAIKQSGHDSMSIEHAAMLKSYEE